MAGSLLAVGAVALTATLVGALAVVGGAHVVSQRVAGAADSAALAAADTASGVVSGVPCERAEQVAQAFGVRVVSCATEDLVVTIEVETIFAGMGVRSHARAGPEGSGLHP